MDISQFKLPHASAGPFWCPPPAAPRNEWHEVESLLAAPYESEGTRPRRSVRSFAFVAAALMIGGGLLAWTLIGSRNDCGSDCHVVTAAAAPTGETAPHAVATAGLAPRSDATMVEGRSVADGATADTPEPIVPPMKHRRHHHHHRAVDF